MPVSVDRDRHGAARLRLSGLLSVREATQLLTTLRELAPVSREVTIDDTGMTGFDVSTLQLVIAFARARREAGRAVAITSGPVAARLHDLGLDEGLPTEAAG